ncbi:MAG: hypothetical protein MJZ98_00425 [Paludibacteraceae bacterium]|nr:hypothetical protein [Paludibacteraceae bacterium]
MEQTITQRVILLLEHYGLSEAKFAMSISVSQSTFNSALRAKNGIPINIISAILNRYVDISAEWLMRGNGEMFISNPTNYARQEISGGNNSGATFSNVAGSINESESETIKRLIDKNDKLTERIEKLTDLLLQTK